MLSKDTAVSPVVAVILMVAVTVTLSAVIGGFALNLGQETSQGTTPSLSTQIEYTGSGAAKIQVITGTADSLHILIDGTEVNNTTNASAGDTITVDVTPNSTITVVSESDGAKTVEATYSTGSNGQLVTAPTEGLLSYWKLDGNANDSEGTNDGTVYGASPTTDAIDGEAYKFNGSGDYIHTADISYDKTHTVSVWIRSQDVVDNRYIAGDFNNVDDTGSQLFQNSEAVKWLIKDGTGTNQVITSPIQNNTWYHVVGTYNGSESRLYVNGTLVASATFSGYSQSTDELVIGRRANADNNYFDGTIDDLRVYNQTLNENEVSQLYNATK